jgi:alpha-1,2-mannosyltransferase
MMMPTVFMNARIAHLPLDVAWALQGAASLAAVAAVVWTYWRRRDPVLSVALFVTATFVVTPYAFNYDMVVFGWVIALLRERGGEPFDDRLAMAVWTLPVTAMLLGLFGIPGSAAVLAAFAVRLLWRLKIGEAARAAPADPAAIPGSIPAA